MKGCLALLGGFVAVVAALIGFFVWNAHRTLGEETKLTQRVDHVVVTSSETLQPSGRLAFTKVRLKYEVDGRWYAGRQTTDADDPLPTVVCVNPSDKTYSEALLREGARCGDKRPGPRDGPTHATQTTPPVS